MRRWDDLACDFAGTAEQLSTEWPAEGFSANEAAQWIEVARCWDAPGARELASAGVTPVEAGSRQGSPISDTIGYAVANGDLSAARAAELIQGRS